VLQSKACKSHRRKRLEAVKYHANLESLPISALTLEKIKAAETSMPNDFPMNINVAEREKKLGLRDKGSIRSRTRIPKLDSRNTEDDKVRLARHPSVSATPANIKEENKLHKPESNTSIRKPKRALREKMFKRLSKPNKEKLNTSTAENAGKEKLVLEPLKMKESEVPSFLKYYKSKVPARVVNSYLPIEELLAHSQEGYNPYWLSFKSIEDAVIKGLVVFHSQPKDETKWQVIILHASTTEELLTELLELTINYICGTIHCKEIKVVLNYIEYMGQFMVYKSLKEAYQKMKFRSVIHNESLKQALILDLDNSASQLLTTKKFFYFITPQ
jgi:hypothetical protein